jgi:hypothetical protein
MLPPLTTLDMIKYMHDEVHQKGERSLRRELAARHGEYRSTRIARMLFRRGRPAVEESREHGLIESPMV